MNSSVSMEVMRLVSQFRSYQDPNRVRSDVSNVSRHYRSLVPKRGTLILNTGQECQLVMLEGTLPTFYRGQQYHTPVEIYITENYPMSPPTCYIRPTTGMSLKKGHRHVDNSGLVYLPYLHEWAARTHNLVELCVNMSNVFGADPPLFASQARATPPTLTPQRGGPNMPHSGASPYNVGQQQPLQQERPHSDIYGRQSLQQQQQRPRSVTYGAPGEPQKQQQRPRSVTYGTPGEPQKQQQQHFSPAFGGPYGGQQQQQAATPQVTTAGSPPPRPLPPTPSPEDIRKEKEKELTRKLQAELQTMYNQLRTEMDTAFETQAKLEDKQRQVDGDVEELSRRNKELERLIQVAKERLAELDAYLEERAKEGEPSVEDLIEPNDSLSDKMLDLVAENAAIEDVLYYLDAGVTDGVITVEGFLKEVRRLARKQFMARATIKKVEKAQRKLNEEMAASSNYTAAGSASYGGFGRGRGYYPSLPPQQQTPLGGRGYMSDPPPRYTPTPTGGDRRVGIGYSSPPPYGQAAWGAGATAGRGGYPTIGTGSFGRGAYSGQDPYTQGR